MANSSFKWCQISKVSQITGNFTGCSTTCSVQHQRKHQSSALLALHEGNPPVTCGSPYKGPVMWIVFPWCHDVKEKADWRSPISPLLANSAGNQGKLEWTDQQVAPLCGKWVSAHWHWFVEHNKLMCKTHSWLLSNCFGYGGIDGIKQVVNREITPRILNTQETIIDNAVWSTRYVKDNEFD